MTSPLYKERYITIMKGLGSFALFGIGFLAFDLAAEYGRLIGRARFLQAANYGLKNQIFDRIIHYDIHAFGAKNSSGFLDQNTFTGWRFPNHKM